MKSSKAFQLISLLLLFLSFSQENRASHVSGGDISYECLGGNEYVVTLNLFRDCSGISMSSSETIDINSSCGTLSPSLPLINGGGNGMGPEISQLCPQDLPNSTCNGGSEPGMEVYTYQDTITISPQCNDWEFSWSLCCRNPSTNLANASAENMYLEATMNSQQAPCNSSPMFPANKSAFPQPYVCEGYPVNFSYGVTEADGDSLVYSLDSAMVGPNTNASYNVGYSGNQPIPGITIDPQTGQINFTPTTQGNFVVVIKIEEYDSTGTLIGTVRRDMQFVVLSGQSCSPPQSPIEPDSVSGTATQVDTFEFDMCEGDDLCFDLTFTDPDSLDTLTINSNHIAALPGSPSFTVNGVNPATSTLCWTAPPGSGGDDYEVTFTAQDGTCPIPGITSTLVKINVTNSTQAYPDQTICGSQDAQLYATGGTQFNWTSISGDPINVGSNFSCNPCDNPVASPSQTTSYEVTSNMSLGCNNIDTVTVTVVNDFTLNADQSTQTACIMEDVQLEANTPDPGSYDYKWTPAAGLNNDTIANPTASLATPGSHDFYVEVTDQNGCTKTDTITLNVIANVQPQITAEAVDSSIACGDSTQLNVDMVEIPPSCGINSAGCSGVPSDVTIGTGSSSNTTTTYPAPYGNFYEASKHQMLFKASELQAQGYTGGQITELDFFVQTIGATTAFSNFEIKLKCTSQSQITSWQSGMQTVLGPTTVNINNGWNNHIFNDAYDWDGTSNLIVEVCFNNLDWNNNGNAETTYTTTSFSSVVESHADVSGFCSSPDPPTTYQTRPNIRFTVCQGAVTSDIQWSPPSKVSNDTIESPYGLPDITTTFSVSVTDTSGNCTATDSVEIIVGDDSLISVFPDTSICPGDSVQLHATGVSSYSWTPASSLSDDTIADPWAFPNSTTEYIATGFDSTGCPHYDTVTVIVDTLTNIDAGLNVEFCNGDSVQLNATGADQYLWSPSSGLNNDTIPDPWASPADTTLYTVTGTDSTQCPNEDSVLVTTNPLPTADAGNDTLLCLGTSGPIGESPTGPSGSSYSWSPATNLSSTADPNPIANPTDSTTYTVVVTDTNGCQRSDSVQVNVPPLPPADAGNDTTICFADTAQLNGTGGTNYTWTPSSSLDDPSIAAPLAFPSDTTTYHLTVQDANGCTNNDSVVVNIASLPPADAGPDQWLCPGDSTQLNASGGQSYSWTPTSGLSNPGIADPKAGLSGNMEYFVEVTDSLGCQQQDSVTITVNDDVPTDAGMDDTICQGDTLMLGGSPTAPAATSYSWTSPSSLNDPTVSNPQAFPSNSISYIVETTNDTCTNKDTINVEVNMLPLANAAPDTSLCVGDSIQLNASGGIVYSWGPSMGLNDTSIADPMASPGDTTDYIVTVTDTNNCSSSDTATVVVDPLPVADAGNDVQVCVNDSVQLNASGGSSYDWNPGLGLSDSTIATPWAGPNDTTQYFVNVTDSNSCTATDSITVTANPLPPADAGNSLQICIGDSTQLSASGGSSYNWTPNSGLSDPTIANPWAEPTDTTEYFVQVTDSNGCVARDSITITVNPLPPADAGNDVQFCMGDSVQLNASGGSTYSWMPTSGLSDSTIQNPVASPSDTTTYFVSVTDSNNCTAQDSITTVVNPLPNVAAGSDRAFCIGDSVQLNGSGEGTLTWSPASGLSDPSIPDPWATPTDTTTYTLSAQDSNNCQNQDSMVVVVDPLPVPTLSEDTNACPEDSVQFMVSGGSNYSWSPGTGLSDSTVSSPWAQPNDTTEYFVLVTDSNGCQQMDSVALDILSSPPADAGPKVSYCAGDSAQLNASGGIIYSWTPTIGIDDPNIANPNVAPGDTTTYYVTVVDTNTCSASDSTIVIHDPLPPVSTGNYNRICREDTAQLNATGANTYTWEPPVFISGQNSASPSVYPPDDKKYLVTGTDTNGCKNQDSVLVDVFRVSAGPDTSVCENEKVMIHAEAEGVLTYTWTPSLGLTQTNQASTPASPDTSTLYKVVVTDTIGCQDSANVNVESFGSPRADFDYQEVPICEGVELQLKDQSGNGRNANWQLSGGDTAYGSETEFTVAYESGTTITLISTNEDGCQDTLRMPYQAGTFDDYYDAFIPNVFTPNGDDKNEVFKVQTSGNYSSCMDLLIYNRWGQLVFKSTGPNSSWSGRNSAGKELPEGTYIYTLIIDDKKYKGSISLLK